MIPFCIDVLQGRIPEQNERRITKSVALILLAHYVADIHQPLHVGAAYFDQEGRATDPETDKSALADEGGNTFTLELAGEPRRRRGIRKKNFHGFWDYDAVNALFPQLPGRLPKKEFESQIGPLKQQLVHRMATSEPRNWQMPSNVSIDGYAEIWADEILPIAREAHDRLEFRNVQTVARSATESLRRAKQWKNQCLIERRIAFGRPASSVTSCTRQGGVSQIYCKRFCKKAVTR